MTFEGQYLTKQEYLALGGSQIEDLPFNLLEFEARRQIDIRTQSRLKGGNNIPQEVKLCEKKLIDSIKSFNDNENKVIGNNKASENTDGYSVSYITSDKISDIVKSKGRRFSCYCRSHNNGVFSVFIKAEA